MGEVVSGEWGSQAREGASGVRGMWSFFRMDGQTDGRRKLLHQKIVHSLVFLVVEKYRLQ